MNCCLFRKRTAGATELNRKRVGNYRKLHQHSFLYKILVDLHESPSVDMIYKYLFLIHFVFTFNYVFFGTNRTNWNNEFCSYIVQIHFSRLFPFYYKGADDNSLLVEYLFYYMKSLSKSGRKGSITSRCQWLQEILDNSTFIDEFML